MRHHTHHGPQSHPAGPSAQEASALAALHKAGRWAELEAAARKMTARQPVHPLGWSFLGLALQGRGAPAEAVEALSRAAALAPKDAGIQGNLGNALKALGRLSEAEACYRRVLTIQPDHASAHNNLGNLLKDAGRLPEAEGCYRRALAIQPDHAGAHSNLGNLLKDLDRLDEAEASCRRALRIEPGLVEAHCNLGNVLKDLGRLSEAEACFRRALVIRPDFADAYGGLGNVMLERGRFAEAEACYRKALELEPDYVGAQDRLLFSLSYQERPVGLCREEALEYGRLVSAKVQTRFSAGFCAERPKRLRVGLVSGDLRRHSVGYFLEGVIGRIDPARIELFAYPTVAKEDDLTARMRPRFAGWRPLVGLDDEAAARRIHADGVHVLLDLSGHTAHNRLPVFAWRPAPVQATWLGYWASTGVAEMDWFLADSVGVPPGHRGQFTERIWYLPETRLCFTPPETDLPVASLPALEHGFVTFGSFQVFQKLNDVVLRLWGRILEACPGARLRLQNDVFSDPEVVAAMRRRLEAQGIDPGQVDLHGAMPRQDYLAAHAAVDMVLDSFPFTGGTTTCEALWMGVPTVTLAGDTLIARQGASLLTAAGLPEWIAGSEDEYVTKAIAFASDLEGLARLRSGLREHVKASPLFDAPRFARALEDALWGMWEGRDKGQDSRGEERHNP